MSIKLKLDFEIDSLETNLKHGDKCVLMGSCFSNEIGYCFKESGFDALSNPFGTIFHPEPLARIISEALGAVEEERIFQRNDLYFSWDAAGTIFALSDKELEILLRDTRKKLADYLHTAKYLFITFGSAFGYEENQTGNIVANCHKMPGHGFTKSMTELHTMKDSWDKVLKMLQAVNPDLQVVFTVSPVRHVKDGLVENNRSKARIFELILSLLRPQVHYFPSFEIVMDELRDYRFYKSDGIHPNEQAIRYVWDRLKETIFDGRTRKLCDEIMVLRSEERHEIMYKNSREAIKFENYHAEKLRTFLSANPDVLWNEKP